MEREGCGREEGRVRMDDSTAQESERNGCEWTGNDAGSRGGLWVYGVMVVVVQVVVAVVE